MTAHLVGFVSRADAGLRKPRSASTNIRPSKGGVGLHYGGPPQGIVAHDQCADVWRAWQRYHMDKHGWSDIAYTFGACDHGYLLAGRGVGVRTAANGTDYGNDHFYAICWLGGEDEHPSRKALEAIEYGVHMLRSAKDGNAAGTAVKPHQFFKGTKCPGGALVATARLLDGKPIALATTPPAAPTAPKEIDMNYTLVRIEGGNEVYAVRPGVWEHVINPHEFQSIVAGGQAEGVVRNLTQAQADALRAFVFRAVPA